jgi:hypothetical protein
MKTISMKSSSDDELFSATFEPSILAVVSFDTAYYPAKKMNKLNFLYPPINFNKEVSVS